MQVQSAVLVFYHFVGKDLGLNQNILWINP